MEIKVYKTADDLAKNKVMLCAPINCPDTFDFLACVSMFKNMYPNCCIIFSA